MKAIKQFSLCLGLIFFSFSLFAADNKFTFEPLYGVETALVRYPEPARYVTRSLYGARVLYGITLLSGEAEYTTANSRKDYPSDDQKVEDTVQNLALGLRSTFALGNYVGFYLRAGGRATQGETKVTTAGVSETHKNPLHINPYAGTGLQLAFASNFALNAGVTMIRNGEDKYDAQYTLGLTARIGKL